MAPPSTLSVSVLPSRTCITICFLLITLLTAPSTASTILATTSTQRQIDFNNGFNHRSHAVPGGPYTAFDHDGTGNAPIIVNGARSHTHYFDPMNNTYGILVSYVWKITSQNDRVVCTKEVCPQLFLPLGRHALALTVTDSTGDVNTGTTSINIIKGDKPAVKYLFYPGVPWIENEYDKGSSLKASMSQTAKRVSKWLASDFLKGAALQAPLSARLFGQLDITETGAYKLALDCGSAVCTFYVNGNILLNKTSGLRFLTVNFTDFSNPFSVVWRLESRYDPEVMPTQPRLVLKWRPPQVRGRFVVVPAEYLSHRPGSLQPVLHELRPKEIRPDSTLVIIGSNFVPRARIVIGNSDCKGVRFFSAFRMSCEIDAAPLSVQDVVVTTAYGGKSNSRRLTVLSSLLNDNAGNEGTNNGTGSNPNNQGNGENGNGTDDGNGNGSGNTPPKGVGYEQRVKFVPTMLKLNGNQWQLKQPTAIVRGPDNRYYFARRDGSIVVTEISGTSVRILCTSPSLGNRAVLGLAFNPADKVFRMYASSSILDFAQRKLSVSTGWKNGEIITFERADDGICVRKSSGSVISGLPVSAFDHAVNKLLFDDDGTLYFSVGSATNAGVRAPKTGNLEDSVLHGAILRARVGKSGFDGDIKYSNGDRPRTAVQVGGDVEVYATGVRNSFGLLFHSSRRLYATDNGGNQVYGARSTGCDTQRGSSHELDKLLLLKKGGFYGAANRARGGRECVHHSVTNLRRRPAGNYDAYVAAMQPATTGIAEFTANTFGGTLRGNLMLSQIAPGGSPGRLYRVKLGSATGGDDPVVFTLAEWSGADIAMSGEGNLFMPRVYRGGVAVLMAEERNPTRLVVTSVWPFRGSRTGGFKVFVTGWGFKEGLRVKFAGKDCTNVKLTSSDGRQATCTAPAGRGRVPVTAHMEEESSGSAGFEFMYMNI